MSDNKYFGYEFLMVLLLSKTSARHMPGCWLGCQWIGQCVAKMSLKQYFPPIKDVCWCPVYTQDMTSEVSAQDVLTLYATVPGQNSISWKMVEELDGDLRTRASTILFQPVNDLAPPTKFQKSYQAVFGELTDETQVTEELVLSVPRSLSTQPSNINSVLWFSPENPSLGDLEDEQLFGSSTIQSRRVAWVLSGHAYSEAYALALADSGRLLVKVSVPLV
ncbi:hypothetical protein EV421DRAFT_1742599 [Armillaria borealis]|uniref:Uncharacterized protein n=1 Tax=Armillaria borealis TaxID=47425 RepID=A0AA39MFY7_9AGAR|nr:hypothetical protein EV421DRAFT_1742599 [Armillaria borealis]